MPEPRNPRHELETRPFQETTRAVSDWAEAPSEQIDPVKKSSIRDRILVAATKKLAMPELKKEAKNKAKMGFRLPVWPTFAIAGVAAVLIIAILVNMTPGRLPGTRPVSVVRALAIPAVHAADAFSVLADKSDAAGMDTTTSLTVTSKVDVTTDDLRQALRIVPAVDVDIRESGEKTFKVTPKELLAPGEIYRVTIAAAVNENGESFAREFSWALQTKNDFRVLSSIPRDGANRVPVTTGIEFKLSRDGWVDPAPHFSIMPSVEGSFITKGRVLTFVPKKPLNEGTRYEVVLKKGFNIAGSDEGLKDDIRLRFETDVRQPASEASEPVFIPVSDRFHFEPGKEVTIDLAYGTTNALQGMRVTGYRLSMEEAKSLLEKRLNIPSWTYAEKQRYADFEQVAKSQAFQVDARLINQDYQKAIALPAMEPGYYAVRLDPVASRATKPSWTFFQVNNAASYIKADKDTLLVWAINPATNRPLSNLKLRLNGAAANTDQSGLGRLQTPAALTTTSTKAGDVYPYAILEVGEGAVSSLMVLRKSYDLYYFDFGNQDQFVSDTVGYLYTDRPLYRVRDELRFFGLAQDRNSRTAPSDRMTLRLRKQTYWLDFGTGEEKVYQEVDITPDGAGRFEGRMAWNELSQGYYTVELRRNNRTVASRTLEVREFVKPAYSIEVTPDKDSVYEGEMVAGTVRVRFFDGTPVPRQKLRLESRGAQSLPAIELETDGNGAARFELKPALTPCESVPQDTTALKQVYQLACYPEDRLMVDVRPVTGEEGEIVGTASISIRRSSLGLEFDLSSKEREATATILTWRHSFTADDGGKSNRWPGKSIEVTAIPWRWERISTGFRYDFIEKKNVEMFRYEARYEPAIKTTLTTNDRGQVVHTMPLDREKDYVLIVEGRDDANRLVRDVRYIWPGGYGTYARYAPDESVEPNLVLLPENKGDASVMGYSLDQEITAEFRIGNNPLDVSRTPGVLYLLGSRGLKDVKILDSNRYPFRLEMGMIPNVEVYGVTWQNGRFVEVRNTAFFRATDRELVIEAKTDKERYAPGENVNVTVTAKSKLTGQPVRDLKFAYAAVDKALLALTYDDLARPLDALYGFVSDGFIYGTRSHEQVYEGFGGAEKGGGGADALRASARTNFKDTAAFGVIGSDSNGSARFSFQAPDNITGWRLELIGLSGALEAGAGRVDVNVSKPVFVEAVLPPRLLVSDKPVLKLRAFGAGLPEGGNVTFVVDAPSLGLRMAKVEGKALEPAYVAVDTLVPGRHSIIIGVETAQGKDALERTLMVDASRFTKNEFVSVDAAPGSAIPELGQAEAEVILTAKNRALLMPYLYELAWSESSRSDAKLAKRFALDALRSKYGEKLEMLPADQELASDLAKYQTEDGMMVLLPYGSADIELTAEVAATFPEFIDAQTMAASLWSRLDDKTSSREIQLQALAGLAALGEPVLPSLQRAAEIPDLSWREQLAIARGLVGAGDRERARALLQTLLERAVDRDNLTRLEVSSEEMDNLEASADAAALAAGLAHPKAQALRRYIDSTWEADAFPVLAKARYLKAVLPTLIDREVRLTYTFGTDDKELRFKDEPIQRLTLTAEEARRFRVTSVDGPITITYNRRTVGKPESKPEVAILRTYKALENRNLADLREGDVVAVELRPSFTARAIDGCYEVTDNLPGGWQPILNAPYMYDLTSWYPYEFGNGSVSFMICGTRDSTRVIRYLARVVTRGSYTAEAALIQHNQYPSISAVSQDQPVTIK